MMANLDNMTSVKQISVVKHWILKYTEIIYWK